MNELSFFNPLKVSSKFPICNLPLRLDTYSTCSYGCVYCQSNNRRRGYGRSSVPNIRWLENKFRKVYDEEMVDTGNFLEVLLSDRVTLHGGGLSDCFQPCELECHYTRDIVELCNNYEQTILFSTKSDNYYDVPLNPQLHSFQLSITNTIDCNIEPYVPSFSKRYAFYTKLKDEGFRVGVRVQPYIPSITDVEQIIELFMEADHFTIESIKLVPGNPNNNELLKQFGLKKTDFTQLGLLNLKPSIRLDLYRPVIRLLEEYGLSWSIADNDLHYLGNNYCCCGDGLIGKGILFSNTFLIRELGTLDYSLDDVFGFAEGYLDCKCSSLYNSDRRNGCVTVRDFYLDRFGRKSAIFSPCFQFREKSGYQSKLM